MRVSERIECSTLALISLRKLLSRVVYFARSLSPSLFVPLAASRAIVHGDRTVGEVGVKQLFNSNSL